MRTYDVRLDVLRNGVKYKTLKIVDAPKIRFNSEAELKSGMSGSFKYDADLNLITDELQPIQIIDGTEYPMGIYDISVSQENTNEIDKSTYFEAYDRCFLLKTTRTEEIIHISAGTSYINTIKQFLTTCGIAMVISDANADVFATDREDWEIGTDYLKIINQLLSEINFKSIWFDSRGYAMLEKKKAPNNQNINHRFGKEAELVAMTCSSQIDIYDKPNVFICVCNNADYAEPLIARAVNDNPISSLSIFKRGRRIAKTYRVDNIASQEELDNYANQLRNESMLSSEIVTVNTPNLGYYSSEDIIALENYSITGIFVELSWDLTLSLGGKMKHKLRRQIIV